MAEPFVGQIVLFAGTFEPEGWAFCQGQALPIATNQPLYALIGTFYGGDGRSTFNVPDLRGRAPIGTGNDIGPTIMPQLTGNLPSGATGGSGIVPLTADNLPPHSHSLAVSSANGSSSDPAGNYLANATALDDGSGGGGISSIDASTPVYGTASDKTAGPLAIGLTGNNAPLKFQTPYIAMNYLIALTGTLLLPPTPK